MKKQILSILLVGTLLIGLTGCGNSNGSAKEAKVINTEGTEETLNAKDIYNIQQENSAKFKKYYTGAKISFDGTVESVALDKLNWSCYKNSTYYTSTSGIENMTDKSINDTSACTTITFEEGFMLMIPSEGIIDVADIDSGSKLHVESNIIMTWNEDILLYGLTSDRTSVDYFTTTIKTIE